MAVKVGFVLLFFLLTFSFIKSQNKSKENVATSQLVPEIILPSKIIIPKLNIDAKIKLVGVDNNGKMIVPDSIYDVGLFSLGPKPGEIGSAVITGHFDDENGKQAVFYDLDKITVGDRILIEDSKNNNLTFIVRKIRKYDEKYAEEVFSSNDMSHLNLITCNGIWNKQKKSYENRIVVFSDLIN